MIDVPVEVKDALREGRLRKNYRVVVLNDDGTEDFTIDNNTLVSESVSIDERMCSGDTIKFGLCEGSSLEFQYFNHENITDRQVQVFCDVEYGEENPYSIPMGFFTVKKCSRQASTGIIKVTAYNKLQSDYLDQKANEILIDTIENPSLPLFVYDIQNLLLNDYKITPKQELYNKIADHGYSTFNHGLSTKLTSQTLDITPINYYNVLRPSEKAWNTTFYMNPTPFAFRWDCDPTEFYTLKSSFDLGEWEQELVEYLRTLIDTSQLSNTGEQFFNWVANTADYKWLNIFGIRVEFADNSIQMFSDEAYSRGVATGGFRDVINKTFTNVVEISLWIITAFDLQERWDSSTIWTYKTIPMHGGDIQYNKQSGTGTYPSFRFPDGSIIPWYGEGGHVEPIPDWFQVYRNDGLNDAEKISIVPSNLPDFTLRDIISANYETVAQFGQLDRVTDLFSGVELNRSRLFPADTLYPSGSLYPYGSVESAFRSQYSKLWADEGNIHKWRYLIITYKGLDGDGNEADFTLQTTINNDGTDDYDCSDNWLFRNLVWTEAQIIEYATAMVAKMQDITWFPFEMWCAGLPYLETGDEIEIPLGNQTYTSYILQRQLKGIQNLQDTYINGTLDIF